MNPTAKIVRKAVRPRVPVGTLVFLVALGALWGPTAFAVCPPDPKFVRTSTLKITHPEATTRYFHDRTTAQIQSMWKSRGAGSGRHNPGLTVFEHKLGTSFQIVGESQRGGKGYCVWAERVVADFAVTRMDVYISRDYGYGSCQYKAILEHEDTHVAINRRTFRKHLARLQAALRMDKTLPLQGNPIRVSSMAEGERIVSARLQAITQPVVRAMEAELRSENAKIDTPESYRKLSGRCPNW